ncbi:hypothetical protein PIB30_098660, partial [Stylosanthes scabra]|nr:hypothetical protein [Stylosanthes scabra]
MLDRTLKDAHVTNVIDNRIGVLQKNKTLLKTDDGKSPGLGFRPTSNSEPLGGAR